ncbi:MAG: PD-(D/E)XK nuclease family protein, partial [Bryobacteraceae bacterium]
SGQIDLWFEEAGEVVVVDYKTAGDRMAAYHVQVQLYALALARVTGRPVSEAWLFLLRDGEAVPVAMENPAAHERRFREAQDRGEFPLRLGEHCVSCPFVGGLCPARLPQADQFPPPESDGRPDGDVH